jgi:hypothetical protein
MKTLKQWIIVIIITSMNFQCKNNTKQQDISSAIEPINEISGCLIGQPLDSEIEDKKKYDIVFSIIDVYEYDINGDGVKEKIILDKLNDWNDPGDFHRVRIEFKDICYNFYNSSGWVEVGKSTADEYIQNFSSISKIKSNYIILSENNNNLLLFVFGYVYASSPGLLTIINLSMKEPQLIFNEDCSIVKYQDKSPIFITSNYLKEENIDKYDTLILKGRWLFKYGE